MVYESVADQGKSVTATKSMRLIQQRMTISHAHDWIVNFVIRSSVGNLTLDEPRTVVGPVQID